VLNWLKSPKQILSDLYQQSMYLLAGYAFYKIMISEFDRLDVEKEERISALAIDPEYAKTFLYEVAIEHFSIVKDKKITVNDLNELLEKYIYPDILDRFYSTDKALYSSLILSPSLYVAWIKKIEKNGNNTFSKISTHAGNDRFKISKLLLKYFKRPDYNELYKVTEFVNTSTELVHLHIQGWIDNGFTSKMS
jgi:hypothetical protein